MKRHAIGWSMVGDHYRNGFRLPGFGHVALSDGTTLYVPEDRATGIDALLDYADQHGIDTREERARLDAWVRTGGEAVRLSLS